MSQLDRYNVESVSEKLLVISGRLIGELLDQRVEESKSWDMTEVRFSSLKARWRTSRTRGWLRTVGFVLMSFVFLLL